MEIHGDNVSKANDTESNSNGEEADTNATDKKDVKSFGNAGHVTVTSLGTHGDAYTVAEARTIQKADGVWVKGYIVGWISGSSSSGAHFSYADASNTNLLLADSMQEKELAHSIPVELVSGSLRRKELNLRDNPANWGRHVLVKGNLTTYFKLVGLKSTVAYEWLNDETEQENEERLSVTSLQEDFSNYTLGKSALPQGWESRGSEACKWPVAANRTEQSAEISFSGKQEASVE